MSGDRSAMGGVAWADGSLEGQLDGQLPSTSSALVGSPWGWPGLPPMSAMASGAGPWGTLQCQDQ